MEDHQELKQIEDQIAELILCLDFTLDTVTTLEEMYGQFRENYISPRHTAQPHQNSTCGSDTILSGLKVEARKISQTRKIAESLLSRVQSTRTLVCIIVPTLESWGVEKKPNKISLPSVHHKKHLTFISRIALTLD